MVQLSKFNKQLNKSLVRSLILTLLITGSIFFTIFGANFNIANAAINQQINYQGKLTNASNVAVADGLYNMTFKLYTVSTGGAAIWTESDTAANKVQVTSGLFSIMLGSTTPFTGVNFNQSLYLGVTIESDAEMTPRKILGATPASIESYNLGGASSTQYVRADQTGTINASSSQTALSITQNSTGNVFDLFSGATNVFSVLSNGNVGIGSTTPSTKFSVAGNGLFTGITTVSGAGTSSFNNNLSIGGALSLSGGFFDGSSSIGTQGMVLQTTGTSSRWVATSTLGISGGSGITSLNGLSGSSQTFATTTTGTDFSIVSSGTIHTFNMPSASASNRGLLTATDWSTFNGKQAAITPGTGLSFSGATLNSVWTQSGNNIFNNNTANVGIGTSSPTAALSVVGNGLFTGLTTVIGAGTSTFTNNLSVGGALSLAGTFFDRNSSAGTNGMVLQTNGAGTQWVATSTLGIGGGSLSGGTNGFLARWTSASTLSSGLFLDNATVAGVNATSSSFTFNVQGSSGVNPFNVASSTGISLLTVLQNGNVGIGTSTPSQNLSVVGTASILTATNTTNAFQVQNSQGAPIFTVDTSTINLVNNPGFESNTNGWAPVLGSGSITGVTTNKYHGISSLQVVDAAVASSGAKTTAFTNTLSSATQYTLSFYAQASSSNFTIRAGIASDGVNEQTCTLNNTTVVTGGWKRFSCTFTSGTISGTPYIFIEQTDALGRTFFLDAVQLQTGAILTSYQIGGVQLRGVVSAPVSFQSTSDSVTALQIQGSAGNTHLFVADTLNGVINIGTSTGSSRFSVVGLAGANGILDIASSTGTSVLHITAGGLVGIGTSTPTRLLDIGNSGQFSTAASGTASLVLPSYDRGNGSGGQFLTLGRNSNATNASPGALQFVGKVGTSTFMWVDSAGNVRVNPLQATTTDTVGVVVGAQTSVRETKQDIENYDDYNDGLKKILDAPLHYFRYKNDVEGYGSDSLLAKKRLGYIADEVDPQFMWGNVIDQVSVNGLLMSSVKALYQNLASSTASTTDYMNKQDVLNASTTAAFASLDIRVKSLEGLKEGMGGGAGGAGLGSELFSTLTSFGSEIVDSISYLKNVFVQHFTTQNLTIKGKDVTKTGFTIYDRGTGAPLCVYFMNGQMKSDAGECPDSTATSTNSVITTDSNNNTITLSAPPVATAPTSSPVDGIGAIDHPPVTPPTDPTPDVAPASVAPSPSNSPANPAPVEAVVTPVPTIAAPIVSAPTISAPISAPDAPVSIAN